MMLSISVHPVIRGSFTCPSLQFQNPNGTPGLFTTPYPLNLQRSSTLKVNNSFHHKSTPFKRIHRISASSAFDEIGVEEISSKTKPDTVPDQENELSLSENENLEEEDEKPIVKPRLVLKFIWMQKNIALGLDKVIPGHGTVPLSPYYFWPKKDAWEELKTTLESKPWISQKKMIILLNQATDIINLWQQGGGSLTS